MPDASAFTVVICTRNRGEHLARTLDMLDRQEDRAFSTLVVDQSDEFSLDLDQRSRRGRLRVLHDTGRGLSRARNLASRHVSTPWVVFMDDDCLAEPDWSRELARAFTLHPKAAFISGHVDHNSRDNSDGLVVTHYPVRQKVVRHGRWIWPWAIGFGVCMAIRRDWIEFLEGWDERLGPGVPEFPAADDMDFNYRLLRSGGIAVAVPEPRVLHDQWRDPKDLPSLYKGYALSWAGVSAKHLRAGDVGGLRLWAWGTYDCYRMSGSAVKRRSRLRFRVAIALWRGHLLGTVRGLRRRW